ncbi:hypothetical protein QOZ80_1AG0032280 [Eleusine coracana subsp. coracana]|nr:hypothetical protein QOZ80_1AG0032280 [Eleusine coracana subsp. coracana]
MCTLFSLCSAYNGQQIIGTPEMIPSSAEFQPQWVTNAPTASCRNTSVCGAQFFRTCPLSLVRSMNPSGSNAARSGSGQVSHSHGPQEPMPGAFEPARGLLQLRRREGAVAPEAEEHHAPLRLRVQPLEARVPLAAFLGVDQRPDAVDFRRRAAGQALAFAYRVQGPRLQPLEAVHEDASRFRHPVELPQPSLAQVALPVLHRVRHVHRSNGRHAGEIQCPLADILKRGQHHAANVGGLEVDCEVAGRGGVEDVRGDAELRRDVERVGTEHVDDEGVDGGQRAEELPERGVRGAERGQDGHERVGVLITDAGARRERCGGEEAHRDRGTGGGQAGQRRRQHGVLVRRVDDGDDDSDAAAVEEGLGQLRHRGQVANAQGRVEDHRLLCHGPVSRRT